MAQDPPKPGAPSGPNRPLRGGGMQILRPSSLPPQPPIAEPSGPSARPGPPPSAPVTSTREAEEAIRTGNSMPPRPVTTTSGLPMPSGPTTSGSMPSAPGGLPMPGIPSGPMAAAPGGLPVPTGGLPMPGAPPPSYAAPSAPSPMEARLEDLQPPVAHTPTGLRPAVRSMDGLPTTSQPSMPAARFAPGPPRNPREELIELHQRLTPRKIFEVTRLPATATAADVLAGLAGLRTRAKELQQTKAVDAATATAVIQKVQELEKLAGDPIEFHVLSRAVQEGADPTSRDVHRRFEVAFLESVMPKIVWRRHGELALDPRFASRFPAAAEATVEAPGMTARVPTDDLNTQTVELVGCSLEAQGELRVFLHLAGGVNVPVRCVVESTQRSRTKVRFKDIPDDAKAAITEGLRQFDIGVMRTCETFSMLAPESPVALACVGLSRFLIATDKKERAAARKALADLEAQHGEHAEVQLACARAALESGDGGEAHRLLRLAQISAPGDPRVEGLVDAVGGGFQVLVATMGRATKLVIKIAAGLTAAVLVVVAFVLLSPEEEDKGPMPEAGCAGTAIVETKLVCTFARGEKAPSPATMRTLAQAALLELRPRGVRSVLFYDAEGKLVGAHPTDDEGRPIDVQADEPAPEPEPEPVDAKAAPVKQWPPVVPGLGDAPPPEPIDAAAVEKKDEPKLEVEPDRPRKKGKKGKRR